MISANRLWIAKHGRNFSLAARNCFWSANCEAQILAHVSRVKWFYSKVKVDVRDIASLNYLFLRVLSRIFLAPSASRPLNEMTGAQKRILYFLDLEGPQRMSDIARLMGVSLPAATITVDKLVEAKLVKRTTVATDRRVVRIELTAKGRRTVKLMNQVHEKRFGEILEKLSPAERQELIGCFQRIHELLSLIDKQ